MGIFNLELKRQIAEFLCEGYTCKEASDEFKIHVTSIRKHVNELISRDDSYLKCKSKPYRVLKRALNEEITIEEARKIFRVSKKVINAFIEANIGLYCKVKAKEANRKLGKTKAL